MKDITMKTSPNKTSRQRLDRKRSQSSLNSEDDNNTNGDHETNKEQIMVIESTNNNNPHHRDTAEHNNSTITRISSSSSRIEMDIDNKEVTKRQRTILNNSNPPPLSPSPPPINFLHNHQITQMKLEAIFHPKFENENINNQQIRNTMLHKITNQQGILEVSLKHSGSLVLWSGGSRFYSKNSTDNVHTYTAEILLKQHFARVWMDDEEDVDEHKNLMESKYLECSNYIERNRLTLSFEVVTSVLGHHGDIPNKDFLILIAIADRNKHSNNGSSTSSTTASRSTFFTTTQLIQFCQKFRLPHNDIWIFKSIESAKQLFHLYDTKREDGLANDVIDVLDDASDGGHMKSLYPHGIFQGQVIEGIVIRFVRIDSKDEENNEQHYSMGYLCQQSDTLLKKVLPKLELPIDAASSSTNNRTTRSSSMPQLLKANLRDIFEQNGDTLSFAQALKEVIKQQTFNNNDESSSSSSSSSPSESSRTISKLGKKEIDIPTIANGLLQRKQNEPQSNIDFETFQICNLIKILEELKLSVSYHVMKEEIKCQNTTSCDTAKQTRCLCIIHILHDSCHQKYHVATRSTGGMSLFRGFSIELITTSDEAKKKEAKQTIIGDTNLITRTPSSELNFNLEKVRLQSNEEQNNIIESNEEQKLMLKMKFVPYMVRTFICRNGMSILSKKGPTAYNQYVYDLLRRWDVSKSAIDRWFGFLTAWGGYCESPSQKTSAGKPLPKLDNSNYLHHYYHFEELYNRGFFKAKFNQATSFYGLVVVAGFNKDQMTKISLDISSTLGCSRTVSAVNELTEADMVASMQSEGGGVVCAATITEGVKKLQVLGKTYKENIYLVMVGFSKEEIEAEFEKSGNPNTKELKKIVGMTNAWKKKLKVPVSIEVPIALLSGNQNLTSNEHFNKVIAQLNEASKSSEPDSRPGILVYFPNIPGCGKSFLCSKANRESLNIQTDRKLIIKEGDKTTGKFWLLSLNEKLKQPSSIYIADKNVPPPSWQSIDNICTKSRGVAVCVLPDDLAFEDTTIDVTFKENSGETVVSHQTFPFSLHFLVVCILRVLNRDPNTHNGKLDSASANACMIVVKFYCLYRTLSVASFLRRISNFGQGHNHIIRVPFLRKDNFLPELPPDLQKVLEHAVSIQTKLDLRQNEKNDMSDIESDLRSVINKHQDFILGLQVPPEVSSASFLRQLSRVISSLEGTVDATECTKSNADGLEEDTEFAKANKNDLQEIHIVSLDINRQDVNSILMSESTICPEINQYLSNKLFGQFMNKKTNDENRKHDRFINKTHCTLAHAQEMNQEKIRRVYGHIIGTSCEVRINAMLFNDDIAALDVTIPKFVKEEPTMLIPSSINKFTHITIWCKRGVNPFESNQLPKLVEKGKAKRIELQTPVLVEGTFNYWHR